MVAPATNQTSTGGATTPGTLPTAPATTASGYAATAVQGYPADTVTAALDQLGVKPNVVMSGINAGQNLRRRSRALSGTIGAARMAARRGIPAVAFSQQAGGAPQYDATGKLAVAWLAQHRAALAKKPKTAPTTIESYNVPNCPVGEVPWGAEGGDRRVAAHDPGDRRLHAPPARSRPPTSRRSTRATPASRTVPVG